MTTGTALSTPIQLWYGYLDESGDVAIFSGGRYLVVALLLTTNPRPIDLHIKRARKTLGRRAKPDEMKATQVERGVTERLLESMLDEDIEIVAVVIDKQSILRPPVDPEDMYREAVARGIRYCVERHSHIELWLDKRYTKPTLRHALEKTIRERIADIPEQVVLLYQEDSRRERGLQAVDHIAWSFYQRYERRDNSLYDIFEGKVVAEDVVTDRKSTCLNSSH